MGIDNHAARIISDAAVLVLVCAGLTFASPPGAAATAPQIGVDNWYWGPGNRWSYKHMRRIFPTAAISRGNGPAVPLDYAIRDLDAIVFVDPSTKKPMTVAQMYAATDSDAFLVMKDGKIVTERYFNGMRPEDTHLLMSVSKSVVGALAGVVAEKGDLDVSSLVAAYVPELKGSGYEHATVRQLLDMTVAIKFDEDYSSKTSDLYRLDEAAGWVPRSTTAPRGLHAYLSTLTKTVGSHGDTFRYISANTDAMGWVLERSSNADFAALLSQELWSRLGAEHDAYIVLDGFQHAYTDPGINTTLRDLGRFAQMMLQNGVFNGQRIVPDEWIQDVRRGGDTQAWKRSPQYPEFKKLACYADGSYRSYWYVSDHRCARLAAIGLAGQLIIIDYRSSIVVIKFSSHAAPNTDQGDVEFAGATAIIDALAGSSAASVPERDSH